MTPSYGGCFANILPLMAKKYRRKQYNKEDAIPPVAWRSYGFVNIRGASSPYIHPISTSLGASHQFLTMLLVESKQSVQVRGDF